MSPQTTSRGFTYRLRVGEREQAVTQALVEEELASKDDEEEEKNDTAVDQHMGAAAVVESVVAVLPYGSPNEQDVGRRIDFQVQDPLADAL